ncbi:hypothetical protein [Shewanella phaeophyticola]|uniref:Uncharacterized protein n=1 Tax=Shewanella phaeophyticola TaxID=2978345 RepID=A0ABT2P312_9GAMM|nr:hypothetical protein [Shewanella sp. KJ10-1]MCT8987009.1 hypothetical protein [Shewanella sp. KJ10-1]
MNYSIKVLLASVIALLFAHSAYAQQITVLNKQGQPTADLVVYLQPHHDANLVVDFVPVKAEVHQKDKQFSPYITVVQKGQEVAFVNEDDITHHIYSALGLEAIFI